MSGGGPGFLYVVVCAAGNAGGVGELVAAAQAGGWSVGVVATPHALPFLDAAAVEAQTGYPIRSAWRRPGDARPLPPADALVVSPATFNTVNKWAAGISDTLALGILCEAPGLGLPIAVHPRVSPALAAHPAYAASRARLAALGVRFVPEPEPGGGEGGEDAPWDWTAVLRLLREAQE